MSWGSKNLSASLTHLSSILHWKWELELRRCFQNPFYVEFGGGSPCYCEICQTFLKYECDYKRMKTKAMHYFVPKTCSRSEKGLLTLQQGKKLSLKYLKGTSSLYFKRWQLRRGEGERAAFSHGCYSGGRAFVRRVDFSQIGIFILSVATSHRKIQPSGRSVMFWHLTRIHHTEEKINGIDIFEIHINNSVDPNRTEAESSRWPCAAVFNRDAC